MLQLRKQKEEEVFQSKQAFYIFFLAVLERGGSKAARNAMIDAQVCTF